MNLQRMEKPQCLAYAFAMYLNMPIDDLLIELGHAGMEVLWPQYNNNLKYASWHIQEMYDVCFKRGRPVIEIECSPASAPTMDDEPYYVFANQRERFFNYVHGCPGVLLVVSGGNARHAVAWDGYKVYDPNGFIGTIDEYHVQDAFLEASKIIISK